MRPLIELNLQSGTLVCSAGFFTHSRCCQPILQTEATATGPAGSQPCLFPCQHHQV